MIAVTKGGLTRDDALCEGLHELKSGTVPVPCTCFGTSAPSMAGIAWLESGTGSLGAVHYDELDPQAQAERRQVWSDGIDRRIEGLDLRSELEASGFPYSSLDLDGNIVTHYPRGTEPGPR